jgi:arsenate reductase
MKFSFGKRKRDHDHDHDIATKTILFVCVQNAGRSQMAEAFFRKYAQKDFETISAGTVPTSQINPIAVEVMKEVGIDISKQKPKDLTEDMMRNATAIINMGCMDDKFCPALFVPKVIDWAIEDPIDKPIERVREIRDEIKKRVLEIVSASENNKIPI